MILRRMLRPLAHGLRSLLGTNGLAAGLAELQRSLSALPRPDLAHTPPPSLAEPWKVALPACMRLLRIDGKDGRRPGFDLVVAEPPGCYDQIQIEHRHYSDIAVLLSLELDGAGTLVDLGANIGTVALPVAASGSHVVAVEMVPSNFVRLLLAGIANELPHLLAINAAIGSSDGTLCFAGEEAWASVTPSQGQAAACLRLDTLLAGIARHNPAFLRPPFALKIDVEGHEYQALLGAQRFLAECRPTVMFESIQLDAVMDSTVRCKTSLSAAGYRLFMLRDQLLVPKAPHDVQEELVGDFVAIPDERVAAMAERFPGFEIRQPSMAERLRWLRTLLQDTADHQKHALKVIDAIGATDAAFSHASAALRGEIETALASDR